MGAAVMGGGIQFGLSTLLPSPAPSGTDSALQQARAVAGEVTARLQALPLSDGQRYILASSLRPAPRNPFTLPANGLPDAQQSASANASGLVYSGYVQAGKEALAIIGGLEYGVGDRVRHLKYGDGTVTNIVDGPRDYQVTVQFDGPGQKIMYAAFAKLKKI